MCPYKETKRLRAGNRLHKKDRWKREAMAGWSVGYQTVWESQSNTTWMWWGCRFHRSPSGLQLTEVYLVWAPSPKQSDSSVSPGLRAGGAQGEFLRCHYSEHLWLSEKEGESWSLTSGHLWSSLTNCQFMCHCQFDCLYRFVQVAGIEATLFKICSDVLLHNIWSVHEVDVMSSCLAVDSL